MDLKAFVNEEKEQLSLQEEIVKLNKLLSEKIKKKIPEIAEKSFTDFREYFSIKAFDVTVSANTITAKINDKIPTILSFIVSLAINLIFNYDKVSHTLTSLIDFILNIH